MRGQLATTRPKGLAALARAWSGISEVDRKRRAVVAAHEWDATELWSLAAAELARHGRKGGRTSQNTVNAYKTSVHALVGDWRGRGWSLLRPGDAGLDWIRELEEKPPQGQGLAPATVRGRLAAGKLLFRALRWTGATEARPFEGVRVATDPTPPEDQRKPYSQVELAAMLAAATPVERVFVLLGAHAGLRLSEALELRWKDVRLSDRELRVQGKGGRIGHVAVSSSLAAALGDIGPATPDGHVVEWRQRVPQPSRPVTRSDANGKLRRLLHRAGVDNDGRSYHGLRHLCGTMLYEQTHDLVPVQQHLRHADISTSRRYAKAGNGRVKSAMEGW